LRLVRNFQTVSEEEFSEVPTILSLLSEEGASMGIPSRPGATLLWVS
jgi:hypothetical protein